MTELRISEEVALPAGFDAPRHAGALANIRRRPFEPSGRPATPPTDLAPWSPPPCTRTCTELPSCTATQRNSATQKPRLGMVSCWTALTRSAQVHRRRGWQWPVRGGRTARRPCRPPSPRTRAPRSARQCHHVRGQHDVGVVEERVIVRRFGVEDVEADARQPPVEQGSYAASRSSSPPRPQLISAAPGLTSRSAASLIRPCRLRRQWRVQADHVRRAECLLEAARGVVGVGIVREHAHAEGARELGDAPADAAVADHRERRAIEVAERERLALAPAAIGDHGRQRPEALDEMEHQRDGTLGDASCSAVGRDDDGMPRRVAASRSTRSTPTRCGRSREAAAPPRSAPHRPRPWRARRWRSSREASGRSPRGRPARPRQRAMGREALLDLLVDAADREDHALPWRTIVLASSSPGLRRADPPCRCPSP